MKINQWLEQATRRLNEVGIPSPRLDAELILADTLGKDRTWLITHGDDAVDPSPAEIALARRLAREPLAYIRGYKEFYGRDFIVTPDTLIPRPETETIIEIVKNLPLTYPTIIQDVGTGSGCIGVTLKLELPDADVFLSDYSAAAVKIARKNAEKLGAKVHVMRDDLMENQFNDGSGVNVIVANLPYVDKSWNVSAEVHHEPLLALYADDDGLALVKKLLLQAQTRLLPGGYIVLEADPRQHDTIIEFGHKHGFDWHTTNDFIVVLQKR